MSTPDVPGYEALRGVLEEAYSRSARGKGQERHSNGMPFHQQTICTALETMGQHAWDGQVVKKMLEADRLSEEAGDREILDAIVYLAARVVVRRKARQIETPSPYLSNPGSAPELTAKKDPTPEAYHSPFPPTLPVNYVLCSHGRIGHCDKCPAFPHAKNIHLPGGCGDARCPHCPEARLAPGLGD